MSGLRTPNAFGQWVEGHYDEFKVSFESKWPVFFHIAYDPVGTHTRSRAFIGFLLGFFMALIFCETIIAGLEFGTYTSLALGSMIVILLSVGCASSIQVRCICLLTIPTFLGRSGRGFLKALVLGYVIAGPIFNLTLNGKEVVRTFACTTQLTYNLTKTRFDLMFKPFQEAMFGMKADMNEVKDTLSSVRDLMSPIVEEIEGQEEMMKLKEENDYLDKIQGDSKRSDELSEKEKKEEANAETQGEIYEVRYRAKIEARCEEQLSHGSEKCREMFADAYDKCYDKVSIFAAWLLCWPMKLTFICNTVQALGGSSICDPRGKVETGIGEGYASLKESQNELMKSLKDAKLQYKIKKSPVMVNVRSAQDTAKAVMHEFNIRKNIFESIMLLIKRCLAFIFIKIILNATNYHESYLTEIEFDNIYVTPYFRKIDHRRKARKSQTLLPLKKLERLKFIDLYQFDQSKIEKSNLCGPSVKLILEILTATSFVLLDALFFETLDLIRRHAYIEYTQAGHHDLSLEVKGSGVIASLIRSVIHGFNVKKRINVKISNQECLPKPIKLPSYILWKIYGTYIGIWLILFITAYTQRVRHLICAYFYRKREKRRVLYVYNETLKGRVRFLKHVKKTVRATIRALLLERDLDLWKKLIEKWPDYFNWLRFFAFARDKCLICNEVESRQEPKFHECDTIGCNFVYCPECWKDINQTCYACTESPDSETDDYDSEHEI